MSDTLVEPPVAPSCPPQSKIASPVITPLLPSNPPLNSRNSEGDFIKLSNGSVLFAFSHFVGDCHYDHEPAFLAGRISRDNGVTWTAEDHMVLANDGGKNVMGVSLHRTLDGRLAIFYNRKNSVIDCRVRMRVSPDEGKTWGEPRLCITEPGYYPVNNDRVVRLSTGRLIIPSGRHGMIMDRFGLPAVADRSDAMAFYSDDDGLTWKRSTTIMVAPEESASGLQEPGIIELRDGRLRMWHRTDMGSQYQSFSDDGGDTWTEPRPSNIISPLSPASIKRLPQTGDLVLVWNDHSNIDERRRGKRTPLVIAISKDEGATWINTKIIEDKHLDGYYCYTAIEFFGDRVMLSYCAGDQGDNYKGLELTSVAYFDYRWLYE